MMKNKTAVLIDDDPEIQIFLAELFGIEGYATHTFGSGTEALEALGPKGRDLPCDVIICDLKLPDIDGLEVIDRLRLQGVSAPVILVTAHGAVETAIEALQKGAFDYITKPINAAELLTVSSRAIKLHQIEQDYEVLRRQVEQGSRKGALIGKSHKMQQIFTLIDRVAVSTASVLITGESGTGKEMVARAIHDASPRASKPFIAINCSAIPDNLLESELFGHKRGSFTGAQGDRRGLFEEANGGTLFLDEIGDMPRSLQSKLLRVLQERKVRPVGANINVDIDVRVIAATNMDLKKAINEGIFREDLYFRLSVVPIELPALRERSEDIPYLAEHFLKRSCAKNNISPKRLTKDAFAKLMRLPWKGNVRELENTVERAAVMTERDIIDHNDIRTESTSAADDKVRGLFAELPSLLQLEREYISYVLTETGDHKERAAEILGINRKTLYRKEREYGIKAPPAPQQPASPRVRLAPDRLLSEPLPPEP